MRSETGKGRAALRAAALVMVLCVALAGCLSAEAQQGTDMVNSTRAQHGLSTLRSHPELEAKAQRWAERLAAEGRLYHSTLSDGVHANWRSLGENVGYGGSIPTVHDAFLGSPAHRANILERSFNHVGIGVAWSGSRVYVVQVFMQL